MPPNTLCFKRIVTGTLLQSLMGAIILLTGTLVITPKLHASGGFWSPPRWAEDLRKQGESQMRQVEQMSAIQQDVTAGSRELVAADATARKDWVALQSQMELTRADLTAQHRSMQEAHHRLEEERRAIESVRRLDLLSSSSIQAIGSILACLVPLFLIAWLLRTQHQIEEPTVLNDQYLNEMGLGTFERNPLHLDHHRITSEPRDYKEIL